MTNQARPLEGLSSPDLHQVGALPLRSVNGVTEVCLITTRETGRWTVPKGWPMDGRRDCEAAAIEASEEAGLLGTIDPHPIGSYRYDKRRKTSVDRVSVDLYRMAVTGYLKEWREQTQREVRWFPCDEASKLVQEPDLQALIATQIPATDEGR